MCLPSAVLHSDCSHFLPFIGFCRATPRALWLLEMTEDRICRPHGPTAEGRVASRSMNLVGAPRSKTVWPLDLRNLVSDPPWDTKIDLPRAAAHPDTQVLPQLPAASRMRNYRPLPAAFVSQPVVNWRAPLFPGREASMMYASAPPRVPALRRSKSNCDPSPNVGWSPGYHKFLMEQVLLPS